MKADETFQRIKASAEYHFAQGITSAELYQMAEDQRATGFGVSADYTRCLASFVKSLEQGKAA